MARNETTGGDLGSRGASQIGSERRTPAVRLQCGDCGIVDLDADGLVVSTSAAGDDVLYVCPICGESKRSAIDRRVVDSLLIAGAQLSYSPTPSESSTRHL